LPPFSEFARFWKYILSEFTVFFDEGRKEHFERKQEYAALLGKSQGQDSLTATRWIVKGLGATLEITGL
jgi:hypothetical protein